MSRICYIFFYVLIFVNISHGNLHDKKVNNLDHNKMVGINAVHKKIIDKDTIITKNMNLERRLRSKPTKQKPAEDRDPDWSYSSFPPEVTSHVDQFKRNMTECLREVQANDKRTVKRLSPKKDSPVHGECLIACVLKRNKVIDNGKVNKANLIHLVSKFYAKDTKMIKKLDKNLDRCVELTSKIHDECLLASRLNDCTNDLMTSNKHKITVNY